MTIDVTIYHNPECGTSRNTLAMIDNAGIEPNVIEYLKNPPSREQLSKVIADAGLSVREAIREKGTPYAELGLDNPDLTDEQLLDAMLKDPILINRPFVITPLGTRLSRPSELVLEILPETHQGPSPRKTASRCSMPEASALSDLPAISPMHLRQPDMDALRPAFSTHKPRILILYGSLRAVSYSRFLAQGAARLLEYFGCEVRIFNPEGLPLPDAAPASHPKFRSCANGRHGLKAVWVSPERHGAITGIMKAQIDWIPLSVGSVRPTQGKTLAVMQVSGGSQSFNAVSQLRILGRWMRMIAIPNQSSVAKAFQEFDANGRMKPSSYYDRVVDVCEELVKFTLLTRDASNYLTDRYSERKEEVEKLEQRVSLRSL